MAISSNGLHVWIVLLNGGIHRGLSYIISSSVLSKNRLIPWQLEALPLHSDRRLDSHSDADTNRSFARFRVFWKDAVFIQYHLNVPEYQLMNSVGYDDEVSPRRLDSEILFFTFLPDWIWKNVLYGRLDHDQCAISWFRSSICVVLLACLNSRTEGSRRRGDCFR
jgi:hypothetical protein